MGTAVLGSTVICVWPNAAQADFCPTVSAQAQQIYDMTKLCELINSDLAQGRIPDLWTRLEQSRRSPVLDPPTAIPPKAQPPQIRKVEPKQTTSKRPPESKTRAPVERPPKIESPPQRYRADKPPQNEKAQAGKHREVRHAIRAHAHPTGEHERAATNTRAADL
ncbi:hypothetical protein [Microtetraspora malaysiensis]|uniref:hypothetical protein n=1 Tax=Microtetraspora malaysiensis TaxID=161358 RepID=UPI003D8E244A